MCFEWNFQVTSIFSSTMFFWVLWNIFFWWTGEYINFTCYNVVFYNHYSIYLRRAENLVAHATETKNVPKLVPWLKQKISDFCGSNVGIFKWLFSRQKMSAKYFMMHKKVGDDTTKMHWMEFSIFSSWENYTICFLNENYWWKPELLLRRNEELYLLNFCKMCVKNW